MNLFKSKKILAIAIDCGFDGVKVDINKQLYTFPSYIIPLDAEKELILSGAGKDDRIVYSERLQEQSVESYTTYIMGSTAKILINNYPTNGKYRKLIDDIKVLEKFFVMKEAVYMIRAAIAYSLIKYSESNDIGFSLEKLSSYMIYLELAFPHSLRKQALGYLCGPLGKPASINLQINGKTYSVDLNIKLENIYGCSQVLAVFNGLLVTEDGKISPDFDNVMGMLPAVVCDGGYRTNGLAYIRNGEETLIIEKVASYEQYSMIEVNKEVARIINECAENNQAINYNPIREYDITQYISSKSDFVYDVKDINTPIQKRRIKVKFDEIEQIRKDVLKKMSEEYCTFLINEYGIGNANTIIIAGGTGASYDEMIREYMTGYAGDDINIILVEDEYNGSKISPVFAVVVGAHKDLMSIILSEINE